MPIKRKNKTKRTTLPTKGWIDISVPLSNDTVYWPTDTKIKIDRVNDIKKGDDDNLTYISMCAHTGTHMDAPRHFLKTGTSIDKIPIAATMGKVRIIEIQDTESIKVKELKSHRIQKGERIIFKTRNSRRIWHNKPFDYDYIYISTEAAEFLAERNILMVGVDYLSIGGIDNCEEVHKTILKAGIYVIEGLVLFNIEPGNYELLCLPIKIKGADGAPSRALIRPL